MVNTTATATARAAIGTSSGYGRCRMRSATAAICVTVLVLPSGAAAITRPWLAPTDRRMVISSSREKITTTTHAATSPSWTRTISTERTSSLSASGSRNGKRSSSRAIKSGIAASRLRVKRLGRFTKVKCATPATAGSFEPDLLQQIVNVRQVHQHLTRFGALVTADHTVLGELIDDPARTRIADVELALHERHRSPALGGDSARGPREQRIQLALRGLASLPLRAGALFEDLLHVARPALRTPEVDDRLDLRVADERALDARGLAGVDRLVQHVAAAEKFLSTPGVEDHPAVDLRADREGDARGDVGLDETRDDVRGGPLRGDHEVDADRARQLGDAAYELFDLACGDHHQVGELVYDDDDVGQLACEALRGLLVVGGDVPHALSREHLVAPVHLRHRPPQRSRGLV